MTHPLFAAIDAAIATHGWPDGVYMLHLAGITDIRASITVEGDLSNGRGVTLQEAWRDVARKREAAAAKADAVDAARRALEAAGLDPDLVKG